MFLYGVKHRKGDPFMIFNKSFLHSPMLLSFLILGFLLDFSGAQAPTIVYSMGYVAINNTLYVHGGSIQTQNQHTYPFKQLFSLDISPSWNSDSPQWKNLTNVGTPEDSYQTLFPSADQKFLISWGFRSDLTTYSIADNAWSTKVAMPPSSSRSTGLQAVVDPTTKLVYIPSGGEVNGTTMIQFDTITRDATTLPMPSGVTDRIYGYGATWSSYINGIIMYGGQTGYNESIVYQKTLFQYIPSSSTWTNLTTTGVSPGTLTKPCVASAQNGTKIIVFGGIPTFIYGKPTPLSGSIFILDLPTMVWSQGPSVVSTASRSSMACVVSGDELIIWGGSQDLTSISDKPLTYNIRLNQWTSKSALANPVATPSPTPSPDPETSGNSSTGIIIGVVVAVAVLLAGAGFFIYHRRKKARTQNQQEKDGVVEDGFQSVKPEKSEPRDPQSLDKAPRLQHSREPQWASQAAQDENPRVLGPHALLPESRIPGSSLINDQTKEQIEKIKALQQLQLQQRQFYLEQIAKEQDVLAKLHEQLNSSKSNSDAA